MRIILKLQRPLASSDPSPPCLAYNKDRSFLTTFSLSDEEITKWFGKEPKVYVKAEIEGEDITILAKTIDQPW